MGAFYGSVHVRTENRKRVIDAASGLRPRLRGKGLVGPPLGGWVAVYFEIGEDDRPAAALAAALGDCDVLQLIVHDDDVFMYNFYHAGAEVDCYTSEPGYFDEQRTNYEEGCVGKPEAFGPLLDEAGAKRLRAILDRKSDYPFAGDRLREMAALFGIRNAATCYGYLADGDFEGIDADLDLVPVPSSKKKR